jgi:hypothetical protein
MENKLRFDWQSIGEEKGDILKQMTSLEEFANAHVTTLHLYVLKERGTGVIEHGSHSSWASSFKHFATMLERYHPFDNVDTRFIGSMIPLFDCNTAGEACYHVVVPLPCEIPLLEYERFLEQVWTATLWGKSASELKPLPQHELNN